MESCRAGVLFEFEDADIGTRLRSVCFLRLMLWRSIGRILTAAPGRGLSDVD